jgi:hypothetical protein
MLTRSLTASAASTRRAASPGVIALADQAEIYEATVTAAGVPLRLGRIRRIASVGQTAALIARGRGCSFLGCHTAPE